MKLKIKYLARRYRAILVMATFMLFNLISSLYFGLDTEIGYNLNPASLGEWGCDIVASIGQYFALMLGGYDLILENARYALAVKKMK